MAESTIPVGTILIMHAEFERVAASEATETAAHGRRARLLAALLDELIEFRARRPSMKLRESDPLTMLAFVAVYVIGLLVGLLARHFWK